MNKKIIAIQDKIKKWNLEITLPPQFFQAFRVVERHFSPQAGLVLDLLRSSRTLDQLHMRSVLATQFHRYDPHDSTIIIGVLNKVTPRGNITDPTITIGS